MFMMRQLAGAFLLVGAFGVAARGANTETVLHSFVAPPGGSSPSSGLIGDPTSALYGTTYNGGSGNAGVVYRLDASGETVLYNFTGGADGKWPYAGVIRDWAGNLYGTTQEGGAANSGVVYVVSPTGEERVLYSFTGQADGGFPIAGVVRDGAGNLYGATYSGGAEESGIVFKLDPTGRETVLYSFSGGADGRLPYGGLVRDADGNLYGTTSAGGAAGYGTVYKVDTEGHETVLHSFGFADGSSPQASLIRDAEGNLYGTTYQGGSGCGKTGCGVVFKLDPSGNETLLHGFSGVDGEFPEARLVRDADGNFYGTTLLGGTTGFGVVFKLNPAGNETVLLSFAGGADGAYTSAGVLRDAKGNLFGTTGAGGPAGLGVVYRLDCAGIETVLYGFMSGQDGFGPSGGVFGDSEGNLYGTTAQGGVANAGVVYKMDAGGETVLYSFTGGADGQLPYAGVIRDSAGNLYGITSYGGTNNVGAVYVLDTGGNETVLHSFGGVADGKYPIGGLTRDADGNIYGTTEAGGAAGLGCVYKLDASGHETILYSFQGGTDGRYPFSGVIRDQAGNLIGTTAGGGARTSSGVVYKLDAAGNETVLHRFREGGDGRFPLSGLVQDAQGNLYGTTEEGGSAGVGAVYKLDVDRNETVIYSFTGAGDGRYPSGGVTRDTAGNLYGTAGYGGTWDAGVVFMLNPAGHETVLYSFTGGMDGGTPGAGVILGPAGNLFGTTLYGGAKGGGVIFKVSTQ